MLDKIRVNDGEERLRQFLRKFQDIYTQEQLRFFPVSTLDSSGYLFAFAGSVAHNTRHDFNFSAFTPVAIPNKARALSLTVIIYPDETTVGYASALVQTGPLVANRVTVATGYAQGESGQMIAGSAVVPNYPDGVIGVTPFWADSSDSNIIEVYVMGYWA